MDGNRVEELHRIRAENVDNRERHRMLVQNSFQITALGASVSAAVSVLMLMHGKTSPFVLSASICIISMFALILIRRFDDLRSSRFLEVANKVNSELEVIAKKYFLDSELKQTE